MRLLLITNSIDLWKGGHCRNIHFLANALVGQGLSVEVFAQFVGRDAKSEAMYSIRKANLPKYTLSRFGREALRFYQSNASHYDIIHANGGVGYAIGELPRNARSPLVVHLRADNRRNAACCLLDPLAWDPLLIRQICGFRYEWFFERRSLSECDAVFCNSSETCDSVSDTGGGKPERYVISYNGVCLPQIAPSSPSRPRKSFRVGYLAHLGALKGWTEFIRIAHHLSRTEPSLEVHIAGHGRREEYVLSQVRKFIPRRMTKYWGKIDAASQRDAFFGELDVFVCPTAPGTTATEALSYQVPVFVARPKRSIAAGMDIEPFVDCGAAFCLVGASPEEAAQRLCDFHGIDKLLAMKRARAIVASEYDWGTVAKKAIKQYSKIIAE